MRYLSDINLIKIQRTQNHNRACLLIKLRFNKLCLFCINQFRYGLFSLGYYRNNKTENITCI